MGKFNRSTSTRIHMASAIAIVGVAFTLFVFVLFSRGAREQERLLLEQSHRSAWQKMEQEIDVIRRRLTQVYGARYASALRTLTFQKNANGILGARGSYPLHAWTPIERSVGSTFRSALNENLGTYTQILDTQYQPLLTTPGRAPKTSQAARTNSLPGSNLVLRSIARKSPLPISLGWLLVLSAVFWAEVGALVLLLSEPEPTAKPRARMTVRLLPENEIPAITGNPGMLYKYLNHKLAHELEIGSNFALAKVSFLNESRLPEISPMVIQKISPHGFLAPNSNRPNELFIGFDASRIGQLASVLKQITEATPRQVQVQKGRVQPEGTFEYTWQ